jgi:hypothetical protein
MKVVCSCIITEEVLSIRGVFGLYPQCDCCCNSNLKYLKKTHMLKAWLPDSGAIKGMLESLGCRALWKKIRSLGVFLWWGYWEHNISSSSSLYFLAAMISTMIYCITIGPKTMESSYHRLKPLKLWAKINVSSF